MKKNAVIYKKPGNWFEDVFDTEAEALDHAESAWDHMTAYDKKHCDAFFVAACEVDENGCVDYERGLDPIKTYK